MHRKSPVPETPLQKFAALACNFIEKETLAQVFSCEFQEMFKNTFFSRTHSVTASVWFVNSFKIFVESL